MISISTVVVFILTILYTFLQILCISIYFNGFMERKLKCQTFYLIGFILMGILKLLPSDMLVFNKLILTIFILMLYVIVSFDGSIIQKLYHVLYFILIEFILDLALFLITNRILLNVALTYQVYFLANFISLICMILIVKTLVVSNINQKVILKSREYLWLSIIPLLSLLSVYFIARLDALGQIMSYFFLIAVNVFTTIIYKDLLKHHFILHDYSLIESQNEHYKDVLKSQKEVQHLKHDLKNILINFSYNLEYQQINQVKKQLKLILNSSPLKDYFYSGYVPIDAILITKIEEMKEHNIIFKTDFQFPEDIEFDNEIDVIVILGNILDNAIEAVQRLSHDVSKVIKMSIKYDKNKFFICVENSSNYVNLSSNKKEQISEKRLGTSGIGISSIKSRVDKLNGYYDFNYDSGLFSVIVILPLK